MSSFKRRLSIKITNEKAKLEMKLNRKSSSDLLSESGSRKSSRYAISPEALPRASGGRPDTAIMCDFLQYEREGIWKVRYVVLKDGHIMQFKDQKDTTPLGLITLSARDSVDYNGLQFVVHTRRKDCRFQCRSATAATDWACAIDAVIKNIATRRHSTSVLENDNLVFRMPEIRLKKKPSSMYTVHLSVEEIRGSKLKDLVDNADSSKLTWSFSNNGAFNVDLFNSKGGFAKEMSDLNLMVEYNRLDYSQRTETVHLPTDKDSATFFKYLNHLILEALKSAQFTEKEKKEEEERKKKAKADKGTAEAAAATTESAAESAEGASDEKRKGGVAAAAARLGSAMAHIQYDENGVPIPMPVVLDENGMPIPPPPPGSAVYIDPNWVPLKPLHWTKLLDRNIRGTIWELLEKCIIEIEVEEIEALFERKPTKVFKKTAEKKAFILETTRDVNVSIILSRIPELMGANTDSKITTGIEVIRTKILSMDSSGWEKHTITSLMQCLPSQYEKEDLEQHTAEQIANMRLSERFMYCLIKIPRVQAKLEAFVFSISWEDEVSFLQSKLAEASTGIKMVLDNWAFQRVLSLILFIGNVLNRSNPKGNAKGFKLDSLLQLESIKATATNVNLLNYIVRVIDDYQPEWHIFASEFIALKPLLETSLGWFDTEIKRVEASLAGVRQEQKTMQKEELSEPGLVTFSDKISHLVEQSSSQVSVLVANFEKLKSQFSVFAMFFGEDPAKVQMKDMLQSLIQFSTSYEKAKSDAAARGRNPKAEKEEIVDEDVDEEEREERKQRIREKLESRDRPVLVTPSAVSKPVVSRPPPPPDAGGGGGSAADGENASADGAPPPPPPPPPPPAAA